MSSVSHNNSKRRRQETTLLQGQAIDEEIKRHIAIIEQAIEQSTGAQREHYRALLRRLQRALKLQPDIDPPSTPVEDS